MFVCDQRLLENETLDVAGYSGSLTKHCTFPHHANSFPQIVALKQLFPKIGSSPGFPPAAAVLRMKPEICKQTRGCPCRLSTVVLYHHFPPFCLCFSVGGRGPGVGH